MYCCRSWLVLLLTTGIASAQGEFVQKLRVQKATKLDWRSAVSDSGSLQGDSGTDRMNRYVPERQLYDFFGPRRVPDRQLPLILFISPANVPHEWKRFEQTCRTRGILFAGPRNVGNAQDANIRLRAAIEVLGDVRRRYRVDTDRTYIAGFSGGAIVATRLAFAMPEICGGLICIGQRLFLPGDQALRDRSSERIAVAALCGANELVGPEVEHLDQRMFVANAYKCRVLVSKRSGHRMPQPGQITSAVSWLDGSAKDRKTLANKYPATRYDGTLTDDESRSAALFSEARTRASDGQFLVASNLLRWITRRWPDSESAKQATEELENDENLDSKSIEELERLHRDRVLEAISLGYEKLANDRRSWFTSERRAGYAREAIRRLQNIQPRDKYAERIETLTEIAARGKKGGDNSR